MKKEIVLIDAGTGNLRSVQKALESVGAAVMRTDDSQAVLSASKVVLPGVGAFGDFMAGAEFGRRGQGSCDARCSVAWDLRRDASFV
jgi:glutamine amidotransferase